MPWIVSTPTSAANEDTSPRERSSSQTIAGLRSLPSASRKARVSR
jgi:hypothetical protein